MKPPRSTSALEGETPLDEDELAGLIPGHLKTRGDLNVWEQQNIADAETWLARSRRSPGEVLSEKFVRALHRRMFDATWRWAGRYRTSEKSIGVTWESVPTQLRDLLGNTRAQVEAASLPRDEIAARLHHRLVLIHPFANGNGRHARAFTDEFLRSVGVSPFTWGAGSAAGDVRAAYLAALRAADRGEFGPLVKFVRS